MIDWCIMFLFNIMSHSEVGFKKDIFSLNSPRIVILIQSFDSYILSIVFRTGTRRNLRNDLLVAADSITNTMSSLVKELNTGTRTCRQMFLICFIAHNFSSHRNL